MRNTYGASAVNTKKIEPCALQNTLENRIELKTDALHCALCIVHMIGETNVQILG